MSANSIVITTDSPEATMDLGERLGRTLQGGDVLALVGQLGAGKTYLVKGIARGLGVEDGRVVNSPTFVLVNEYQGRAAIHHLDAYRLGSADELLDLGFEEMCADGSISIVEWADRVAGAMPAGALWIHIDATGESERRFTMQTAHEALTQRLAVTGFSASQ